jgi:hypothetical protein
MKEAERHMKRLVAFKLENESTLIVETNEPESQGGATPTARNPGQVLDEAKHTFDQALDKIHAATEGAIRKLRNLSEKPDEVTMEFGFNLNAQFGAIIAATSAGANYKVTITWSHKLET